MGDCSNKSVIPVELRREPCSHDSFAAESSYDIKTSNSELSDGLAEIKRSDFIVWDEAFFTLIGGQGKVEKIQSFPESEHRVHEAPAFLPETNELVFSDTSIEGWLWVLDIDTHEV